MSDAMTPREPAVPAQRERAAARRASDADSGSLLDGVQHLGDLAAHLIGVRADLVRLRVRTALTTLVAGLMTLMLGMTLAVIATYYLLQGAAGAVSAGADAPPWFGRLVVGAMGLCGAAGAARLFVRRARLRSLARRVEKYERLRAIRRARAARQAARLRKAA